MLQAASKPANSAAKGTSHISPHSIGPLRKKYIARQKKANAAIITPHKNDAKIHRGEVTNNRNIAAIVSQNKIYLSTFPTTACPPSLTVTRSTLTVCFPFERYRLSVSI